jgi:hypothetical protein
MLQTIVVAVVAVYAMLLPATAGQELSSLDTYTNKFH